MLRLANLPLVLGLLVWAPFVVAQSTLGELLDTGARKLSADEFKQELVQRVIVGPSPTRGSLEVIYTTNGQVAGLGRAPTGTSISSDELRIQGEWTIDGDARVCTSMRFSFPSGGWHVIGAGGGVGYLPPRCQFWFKLGDTYFLSDSDSDRSAKVLSRTLKQ
jgi:hypothetical protein